MKKKIIDYIKIGVVIAILFVMAVSSVFPSYWRIACFIWLVVLTIAGLNEAYCKLKKNRN